MKLITVDLLDGHGLIDVCVANEVERDRLLGFFKDGTEAIKFMTELLESEVAKKVTGIYPDQ